MERSLNITDRYGLSIRYLASQYISRRASEIDCIVHLAIEKILYPFTSRCSYRNTSTKRHVLHYQNGSKTNSSPQYTVIYCQKYRTILSEDANSSCAVPPNIQTDYFVYNVISSCASRRDAHTNPESTQIGMCWNPESIRNSPL